MFAPNVHTQIIMQRTCKKVLFTLFIVLSRNNFRYIGRYKWKFLILFDVKFDKYKLDLELLNNYGINNFSL